MEIKLSSTIFALFCVMFGSSYADVYRTVDANGKISFSDRPPDVINNRSELQSVEPLNLNPRSKSTVDTGTEHTGQIKVELIRLLKQQSYLALNNRLTDYQNRMERNIKFEDNLIYAYRAFQMNDSKFEALFDEWVAMFPISHHPYLARANYYVRKGWNARGSKWASETTQQQIEMMNFYFAKANEDLEKAVQLDDSNLDVYALKLSIARATGEDSELQTILQKCLSIHPGTFRIRSIYLLSITPRWGGSYYEMQAFIDDSLKLLSFNSRLSLLQGYILYDQGQMNSIMRSYQAADALYVKALAFGPNDLIYNARGDNFYTQKKYQKALQSYNKAISLNSEDAGYFNWRAKTYVQLKDFDQAFKDIEHANAISPGNKSVSETKNWLASKYKRQGYDLRKQNEPGRALQYFERTLQLDPDDADAYYRKGAALYDQNRHDQALNVFEKAVELDPDNYSTYVYIDRILESEGKWNEIIGYWDRYIERNPNNSRAYIERGGTYYRKGDIKMAMENAKKAADLGSPMGKRLYERFRHRVN